MLGFLFFSPLFLLQYLDYTLHIHICKFLFYTKNKVLNDNIAIFIFVISIRN